MSATARLSAVAGDDISIVVVLPAGFTTGKTFALQLRRRNGALVHTATPTVAGDNVLIEIDAETSAAFHAGWLYGHLQVAAPTVATLFRLDLLIEADLTGGTGPVGAALTVPSVSTVSCVIDDTPIDVTVYSALSLGGVSAGGIEFHVGPPPTPETAVDMSGPSAIISYDPEGGPTTEPAITISVSQDGWWSPAVPFHIPAGTGTPSGTPGDLDRLYVETDTGTLWLATPSGWVAVTGGGGGGVIAHADLTGRTAADSHPQSAITGLTSALAEKLSAASNLSDLTDVAAAIDNLGLVGPNQPHGYAELNGAGTLPDVLVPASIARDSEVSSAIAGKQDSTATLNALATLATTAIGRALLEAVDAAALRAMLATIADTDSRLTDARPPTVHAHTAADITAGTIAQARLGTGYGGAGTKFLADDQTRKAAGEPAQPPRVISTWEWATSSHGARYSGYASDSMSGRMWLVPLLLPQERTLEGIGIAIGTAGTAGSLVRFGVYEMGSGVVGSVDGLVGARLYDSGTKAADTTGFKSSSGLSIAASAPGVWLAFVGQSLGATAPTVPTFDYNAAGMSQNRGPTPVEVANTPRGGSLSVTGVTGALPATLTGVTTNQAGIGWLTPCFQVRFSA